MSDLNQEQRLIGRRDVWLGSMMALALEVFYFHLSSGASLIATFVPGFAFAWLVFIWMYWKRVSIPRTAEFMPAFLAVLAIQFLHFAEEFLTDFKTFYPVHYGGLPYSNELFVTFNMSAYAVFALACVLAIQVGLRFLLVPVLFFVMYGALGNAIAHVVWTIEAWNYRPGFYTALLYWVAGPWLLYKLIGSWKHTAWFVAGFVVFLLPFVVGLAVE
ncbi:MAG: hypothetical protein ACRCV6_00640 [Formosimonas sp.]